MITEIIVIIVITVIIVIMMITAIIVIIGIAVIVVKISRPLQASEPYLEIQLTLILWVSLLPHLILPSLIMII